VVALVHTSETASGDDDESDAEKDGADTPPAEPSFQSATINQIVSVESQNISLLPRSMFVQPEFAQPGFVRPGFVRPGFVRKGFVLIGCFRRRVAAEAT
jgi:hypothetical protein